MSFTPTYKSWDSMKDRCLRAGHSSYKNYGGRGISVCERWMKFENFLSDMGLRPEGKTLDRIDNNGNYEPGNCRWSSATEQHRNTRAVVLSEEIVRLARAMKRGGMKAPHIAAKLGANVPAIRLALAGGTWKGIE